ncbi:MAG TPA: PmoA family protein [Puia sp.]|nr:PmoA family protein [Puia sp.]
MIAASLPSHRLAHQLFSTHPRTAYRPFAARQFASRRILLMAWGHLPLLFAACCLSCALQAQRASPAAPLDIRVMAIPAAHKVSITAGGLPFTEFFYPDTLEKPILYPVFAPDGQLVSRGFPFQPRPGEPVDHPHHQGIWFTYENVNGLDFWNNSFAIPADKKHSYGWIRTDGSSIKVSDGKNGTLQYGADWTDQQKNVLLRETTIFIFTATAQERIIDRSTTLTAAQDVSLPDAKDGLLGMRVTKELQIPSSAPGQFIDSKGNITKVAAGNDPVINGTYLTSTGKQGDSAWATRGNWCLLYGKKGNDTLSIAIIDHPSNPGYPTYWHARGYGLFAANPLGQKIFSQGKETLAFSLKKGQSVTFRYRIVIAAEKGRLSTGRIGQLADAFAGQR